MKIAFKLIVLSLLAGITANAADYSTTCVDDTDGTVHDVIAHMPDPVGKPDVNAADAVITSVEATDPAPVTPDHLSCSDPDVSVAADGTLQYIPHYSNNPSWQGYAVYLCGAMVVIVNNGWYYTGNGASGPMTNIISTTLTNHCVNLN